MTFLDNDLRELILARFRTTSVAGTGYPDNLGGNAHARARLLIEIHDTLYDEVKFGAYPKAEYASLQPVGDAIHAHAERMWEEAQRDQEPGELPGQLEAIWGHE